MDPQAVLEDLLGCASDPTEPASDGGDLSEVESKTTYLLEWLDRSGYAPTVTPEQLTVLRTLADAYEEQVQLGDFEEGRDPEDVADQVRHLADRLGAL